MKVSLKIFCCLLLGGIAFFSFSHPQVKKKKSTAKKSKTTVIDNKKPYDAVDVMPSEDGKATPGELVNAPAEFYDNQKKLPLNPAVRYGKLPNGLTYYIQHNTKPENRVEFRLAVNAGSNQEEETQKGLAHFIEHMAFNGSKHFSKNELVNYLEGIGTKFGPHLNAYTSFDETVYMLQLPTDKKEILDKGLNVLEDWANGLSFDTTEINKERGVVFSEWRSGLGADKRMMDKYLPVMYYKSRYASRLPIGDTSVVLHAPYERLISFYKKWYRPDLMSVVIVGDVNVDELESEIKKRFGVMKNPANEQKKEIYSLPEHVPTLVSVCTDPEATYSRAFIIYKHPAENDNSVEGYKKYLMNNLFNSMFNNRLQELMQQPNPPFFAAYSGYEKETRANDAFNLTAVAKSGQTIDE